MFFYERKHALPERIVQLPNIVEIDYLLERARPGYLGALHDYAIRGPEVESGADTYENGKLANSGLGVDVIGNRHARG